MLCRSSSDGSCSKQVLRIETVIYAPYWLRRSVPIQEELIEVGHAYRNSCIPNFKKAELRLSLPKLNDSLIFDSSGLLPPGWIVNLWGCKGF